MIVGNVWSGNWRSYLGTPGATRYYGYNQQFLTVNFGLDGNVIVGGYNGATSSYFLKKIGHWDHAMSTRVSDMAVDSIGDIVVVGGNNVVKLKDALCSDVPGFEITSLPSSVIWPPNHRETAVKVSGKIVVPEGCNLLSASFSMVDEYGDYTSSGELDVDEYGAFSLSLTVEAWRNGADKDGRLYSIVLSAEDEAGVGESGSMESLVPHDMR
jgi:hypothetical protein